MERWTIVNKVEGFFDGLEQGIERGFSQGIEQGIEKVIQYIKEGYSLEDAENMAKL